MYVHVRICVIDYENFFFILMKMLHLCEIYTVVLVGELHSQ